jgi:imidazolonepropionase-like amidohydrolase
MAERTGSIAPELEADIVFLNRNPLENIEYVGDVDTVVQNGRAYRAEALIAMAGVK